MKSTYRPLIIFSVFKVNDTANQLHHSLIVKQFKKRGIPYIECDGVFRGVKEWSFIVDAEYIGIVKKIAVFFDQNSILYLHSDRYAELLDPKTGNVITGLGQFRQIDPTKAKSLMAYTRTVDGTCYAAF